MPGGAVEGGREEGGGRGPVVVVSGPPGGGKTTYARRLAGDLGLRYFTTGMIFRRIARERGVSLVELSRVAERDPSLDFEIDRRALDEAARGWVVFDSHLAGWALAWLADVLVYVKAPTPVRISRLAGRDSSAVDEAALHALAREESQWRRFREYYGYDVSDLGFYHLVIDTSLIGVDEAYRVIREFVVAALTARGYVVPGPYKGAARHG